MEERLATCEDNGVFELDPFDTLVGQEEESDSDDGEDDGDNLSDLSSDAGGGDGSSDGSPDIPSDYKHIQEMLNKLDSILKLVFDHFHQSPKFVPHLPTLPSSRPDSPSSSIDVPSLPEPPTLPEQNDTYRRRQFFVLLSIFDRIILRTFKSRYTQFLIFWYSSLDPEFTDTFQGTLISKALLEGNQPTVTRTIAASYIASFVSRAQFVEGDSAKQVVACLCDFLRNRLEMFEAGQQEQSDGSEVDMKKEDLMIFYAVAQAVFLIFCFRWRDLLLEDGVDELGAVHGSHGPIWMKELDVLKRIVVSELNPLKVSRYMLCFSDGRTQVSI